MKKKLLLVTLVAPLLMVSAQWTQTGGVVKISPETYKYVSGSYEVKSAADGASNEGKVTVKGSFTTPTTSGSQFVNKWTTGTQYGQLILDGTSPVVGKITSEFKLTSAMAYHSIAVPFDNTYTALDLASNAGITAPNWTGYTGSAGTYDANRWKNSVFHWDVANKSYETLAETDVLQPTHYYELFNMPTHGSAPNTTSATSYVGVPNRNLATNVSFTGYKIGKSTDTNNYGEAYGTYIYDPGATKPTKWDSPEVGDNVSNAGYGDNVFFIGNPYTSNIDLETVLTSNATNFSHIAQFGANSYTREDGNGGLVTSTAAAFAASTSDGTADKHVFILRPHHTAVVKLKNLAEGTTVNFDFNHSPTNTIKTFDSEKVNVGSPSWNRNGESFYQVGMDLYKGKYITPNRFYIVASNTYSPSAKSGNEIYNVALGNDDTGFYSLQEKADGTIDNELSHNKVYLNGINATDYVAKPIHLIFQVSEPGEYTLKSRLNNDLLNSGNRYYFEDKREGVILEVGEGFEYTFDSKEIEKDRFVMYWNGLPDEMGVEDTAIGETLVYKDGRDYKVRFDNNWKQADVYVYNMIGQLVHVAKKVGTINDYMLPINGDPAAYIVKVMGDNGDVVTKKIVK